jgi:hypothetical protein
MVSAFSTWKRLIMAALLLLSATEFTMAQGQDVAPPAEGGSLGATNFSVTGGAEKTLPGQGRMEKFEDDLFGTHKPMDVSLPSVPDLTPRRQMPMTPAPDAREREKMDAQKNWMFSGMNELNSTKTPEELMGMPELGPDGREKPRLSAMEKYYDSLGGGRAGASNKMPDSLTMMWAMKQLSGTNSLSPLIFALPGGDQALMKNLMTLQGINQAAGDTAARDDSTSTSAAIAGTSAAAAAASADREQKRRQDTFKEILGLDPAAPASFSGMNSFTPIQPVATPMYIPGSPPATAPFTTSSLSPVTTGFTPAAVGSYHPSDAGLAGPAAGLNYQSVRALEPPPSRPLPPPALDPFAENFPKRKF